MKENEISYVVVFRSQKGKNKGLWIYNNSHQNREDAEKWVKGMRDFYTALEFDILVHDENFNNIGWWNNLAVKKFRNERVNFFL